MKNRNHGYQQKLNLPRTIDTHKVGIKLTRLALQFWPKSKMTKMKKIWLPLVQPIYFWWAPGKPCPPTWSNLLLDNCNFSHFYFLFQTCQTKGFLFLSNKCKNHLLHGPFENKIFWFSSLLIYPSQNAKKKDIDFLRCVLKNWSESDFVKKHLFKMIFLIPCFFQCSLIL